MNPERGSNFDFFFLVDEGRGIQIPLKVSHHRPASEMAFRWPADDGPTLNAGLVVCCFQGFQTSIAKKPYIFVIFQGGPDPCPPSGSTHVCSTFSANKVKKKIHFIINSFVHVNSPLQSNVLT